MIRTVLFASAAAALAACQPANSPPPGAPDATGGSGIQLGLSWKTAVSGAGMSLTLFGPAGDEQLRLACVRDPAVMTVRVERFRPVGSEERLSFGVDDEPFVFVANSTTGAPSGVEASGPIPLDLLRRLESATTVAASYGAQTFGPYMPPDPESAGRFAAACRQIAAR